MAARYSHDEFVYFNNDGNADAMRNARTLQALLAPDGASKSGPSGHIVHSS